MLIGVEVVDEEGVTVKYPSMLKLEEVLQTRYVDDMIVGCMHRKMIQCELDVSSVHNQRNMNGRVPKMVSFVS